MNILSAPWRGFRRWIVGYALLGGWVLALTGATRSAQSPLFAVDNREVLITASATYRDGAGTFGDSAVITITTNIGNRTIFYSLDGSAPTIGGPLTYTSPITIAATQTIRALAVDGDDFSTKASAPLAVTIVPTYALTVTSPGGGTVTLTPAATVNGSATRYLSGTVVTLTATPATGWTWMNWTGDSTATTSTLSVTMTAARTLQGRFGTTLSTSVTGGGALAVSPAVGPYAFGSVVRVVPKPNEGSAFSLWGGASSGSANLLDFTVTEAAKTISALFANLGTGQVNLYWGVTGSGTVSVSPQKNVYAVNDTVTVTPVPGTNQVFTGWSGALSGIQNPATLSLATSKSIVANFQQGVVVAATSPSRNVVNVGGALTLAVTLTGAPVPTLQWILNGRAIPGATTASYTIASATRAADAGWYQLTATNQYGTVTSPVIHVMVAGPTQVVAWGQYLQRTLPPGLDNVLAISGGGAHSLALNADGTVVAWGDSTSSRLAVPAGLADVVAVSVGENHSLVLKADGSVVAWGGNSEGQATVPAGLGSVVGVAAGYRFSAALKADGTVVAWGRNTEGQTAVPTGLTDVVELSVSTNGTHVLALKRDGSVVSWGNSLYGRTAVPAGLSGVVGVAAGQEHSLALKSDGTLATWGGTGWGQLNVPVLSVLPQALTSNHQTLLLLRDGSIVVFGLNDYGQAQAPAGISKAVSISAGRYHSMVLRDRSGDTLPAIAAQPVATTSGAVGQTVRLSVGASAGTAPVTYQWRKDGSVISGATNAELSLPLTTTAAGAYDVEVSSYLGKVTSQAAAVTLRSTPLVNATQGGRYVLNSGSDGVITVDPAFIPAGATVQWKRNGRAIAGATNATLAIASATALKDNGWYVAEITSGATKTMATTIFVQVAFPSQILAWGQNGSGEINVPTGLDDIVSVSRTWSGSLALRANGTVVVWGGAPAVPAGLSDVVAVAGGWSHALALKSDGRVVAWGSVTTVPAGIDDAVAVAAGGNQSLILRRDGRVVAWGAVPVLPAEITGAVAIAAGDSQIAVLGSDGAVRAWGSTTQAAVPLAAQSGIIDVVCSAGAMLALNAQGGIVGWPAVTLPAGLGTVSRIGAGGFHYLVQLPDSTVVAWGSNSVGQTNVPSGLNRVVEVAAGRDHSIALRDRSGDTLPVIGTAPAASATAAAGQTVKLKVVATGGTALVSYQWRKDGVAISGATSAEYALPVTATSAAGSYDVQVSNYLGTVTSAATAVTVRSTPVVNATQGGRYVLNSGSDGVITVDPAFIPAGATVQWKRNGRAIAGATNPTLSLSSVQPSSAGGAYEAVVTAGSISSVSSRVFVFVWPKPGQLLGFGQNTYGQVTIPASLGLMVAADGGESHSIALRPDGTVVAWGSNASGQTSVPAGLQDVIAISAGYNHNLALTRAGRVVAWGSNGWSQANVPAHAVDVVAVAAGGTRSAALRLDGTVVTWGNSEGTALPDSATDLVAIASGGSHYLAMRADGTLLAWGRSSEGQIATPVEAAGAVALSSYYYHNLAITQSGSVLAWGYQTAAVPANLGPVQAVVAGAYHSLALKSDGAVVGWGRNTDAQISVPVGYSDRVMAIFRGGYHSLLLRDSSADTVPLITAPPVRGSLTTGRPLSLSVGAGPVLPGHAYQWRKGGVVIPGATNAVFTVAAAALGDAGSYDVVVSNYLGNVVSPAAVIEVIAGPVITTPPASFSIVSGDRVQLKASAQGTGTLSYQWYQGASGVTANPLAGATAAAFMTPAMSATTSFWVRITDGSGVSTDSPAATVTVSATSPLTVTQQALGAGYQAGGVVAITNTITYSGSAPTRIDWATLLPAGWKYLGSGGSEGGARPPYESGDLLEWLWTTVPASPIRFTYTVSVPSGTTADEVIASLVSSQAAGTNYQTMAKPDPLVVKMLTTSGTYHSADSNRDGRIGLLELTRVIELYNYRIGTTRTGEYHLQAGTEDGFAPGPVPPVAMVLIPGGTFTMGSVVTSIVGADQSDGLTDATPHAVTLSAFYLAKTETTYAEWVAVRTWARDAARGAGVYDFGATVGAGKGDTHPVQTVSWYEVVKWCNAKSEREGLTPVYYTNDAQTLVYRTGDVAVTAAQVKWGANGYRLPTEAEWEYAARGGASGQRFPWGDTITHVQANYSSSASQAYDVSTTRGYHPTYATGGFPYTSPVGVFAANGYGLADMVGNVHEWTWDWYGGYGSGAVSDPRGAASGALRVLRDGSWDYTANNVRSALRLKNSPGNRWFNFGFRPARSSVP